MTDGVPAAIARAQEIASDRLVSVTGGTIATPERQATVADLAGHRWRLTQTLGDVAPEDWGGISIS